jgi:hypothetical protein
VFSANSGHDVFTGSLQFALSPERFRVVVEHCARVFLFGARQGREIVMRSVTADVFAVTIAFFLFAAGSGSSGEDREKGQ